jgi:CRISPR-associated protein Cas5t
MTEKTLYIEIFQPYAQYRNPFTFYYAQTYPLPPRSTIIGMLQNATNRYYDEKFWKLKVSVHGGFESVFWNYQQLIKGDIELMKEGNKIELWNQKRPLYGSGLKSQRTPVYQQELFNGWLYIFLRGESSLIEEIKTSLENPKKVLSLGRSEDVIYIRDVRDIEKKPPKPAKKDIWMTYPTYIMQSFDGKRFPIKNRRYPVYSIPMKVTFENEKGPVKNKAEITKKTERKPVFCTVIHSEYNSIIRLSDKVDIEKIKISDKKVFKIPVEWGWLRD